MGAERATRSAGRRRYDSPVRRRQAAATQERIITAGSELVHQMPSWDWRGLTFRAVAERAGVGERTVYRHFPTERHLHGAVMERLEAEAGVAYDEVVLDTVATTARRVFTSLSSFAAAPTSAVDAPTFGARDVSRRHALRRAVNAGAPTWTDDEQERAAAALDVLWGLPSYERLVVQWGMERERAIEVVTWLIDFVVRAIQSDEPPLAEVGR
jgi:AcrR family transcriptional regulator